VLHRSWDDPNATTIFHGLDLAIHEIGHILWAPLGKFMGIAGGTLTQVLMPAAAGAVLYRQRDWFGVSFAIAWTGIACFEVVIYAGDAVRQALPLVSPMTAEPIHDWTYMLGRMTMLRHAEAVAGAWQWAGRLLMSAGIVLGGRVLWIMATTPGPEPLPGLADEEARLRERIGGPS